MSPQSADDARARAAEALRRFGHTFMEREADDDLLERVTTAAERTIEALEQAPPRTRDTLRAKSEMFPGGIGDGERVVHFDECFVSGRWNPMGIGLQVHRDGDDAVGTVVLGTAFEGAPGRSHGGIVAALFDDVMGYLLTIHDVPAFTGELTVRYLAPTPIGVELTFRSRLLHRDGRRLLMEADAHAAGERIATGSGTFIAVDLRHFER